MEKAKYIKPSVVSLDKVGAVEGKSACYPVGTDPNIIPQCDPGYVATGNCWPNGTTAGQACWDVGSTPKPTACITGTHQ